jgi:hypothetical protein
MPPYKPVVSVAQRNKLFSLAESGDISMDEARGKARAARGFDLPQRVGGKARSPFGRVARKARPPSRR